MLVLSLTKREFVDISGPCRIYLNRGENVKIAFDADKDVLIVRGKVESRKIGEPNVGN